MALQIIGWIVVILLGISLGYSCKVHLYDYYIYRRKLKRGLTKPPRKDLHRSANRGAVVFIQLLKVAVIIYLIYILIT